MNREFTSNLAGFEAPVLAKIVKNQISFEETPETSGTDEMTIGALLKFVSEYLEIRGTPQAYIECVLQKPKKKKKKYPVAHLFPEQEGTIGFEIHDGSEIIGKGGFSAESTVKNALIGLLFYAPHTMGVMIALPIMNQLRETR